ncbi:hypothetical protein [Nonomuraea ceibae]|uniref:hypothetical protein n=1 Tax=Nonomuraea ceibae TaxID=1935170 RepID=UPI001C5F10E5|nr:hypothetical protein [Nonomuraea ceibae]
MINIDALASEVTPAGLRAYLRANSWNYQGKPLPRMELWARDSWEVLIPLNRQASDYPRRIRNFIDDIAGERGARTEDIATELRYVEDDVIDLEFEEDLSRVPLTEAARLLQGARSFAVANACSAIHRRSYHGRSQPLRAREYADHVGMGHTREGSFVIPIVSPIGVMKPVIIEGEQEPLIDVQSELNFFPRRVTGIMADVLREIHELAVVRERIPPKEDLNRAVVAGLSADACAALATMVSAPNASDLDITFQWALTAAPPRAGGDTVAFPQEAAETIRQIGHLLRDQVRVEDTVIYGFVSSLDRDPDDEEGVVKVKALVGSRIRPVKIVLRGDAYHTAIEAHDLKLRVIVTGPMVKSGAGTLSMPRVHLFRVDDYLPLEMSAEPRSA